MAGSHIIFSSLDEMNFELWEATGPWLTIADRSNSTRVTINLTDDVKDRFRRMVRDWEFEEEAALHDMEEAASYPIGQTLAGTFLGVPMTVPRATGCAIETCPVHHPHECTAIHKSCVPEEDEPLPTLRAL